MFGMFWKGIDYFHPHSKFNSVNEDKLHRQREITLTGYHGTKQANNKKKEDKITDTI